jgi:hypothetical protein
MTRSTILSGATVAYELGLICDVSESLGPEALVRELCAVLEPPPDLSEWRYGESWAACEVATVADSVPFTIQANKADTFVTSMALRGEKEGVLTEPLEFQAVISITLVGEIDWAPVQMLVRAAMRKWRGILFDEVSGFNASLE